MKSVVIPSVPEDAQQRLKLVGSGATVQGDRAESLPRPLAGGDDGSSQPTAVVLSSSATAREESSSCVDDMRPATF
jgi:hypothetical protein